MDTISSTQNEAIVSDWDKNYDISVVELFYMTCDTDVKTINKLCSVVWEENKKILVAIMFYTRAFRDIKNIDVNGRGEKLLSYHIALWLLKHDISTFLQNYNYYIAEIGCYRDCLVLAKMAIHSFTEADIYTLLTPMSTALIVDTHNVITNPNPRITLAAKWAPRQKKSFNVCIKYLKKLCGITGPTSDAQWRKYIQTLMKYYESPTPETSLSSQQYDNIEFGKIPSCAFNLYKNMFATHPALKSRFLMFLTYANMRDVSDNHIHNRDAIKPPASNSDNDILTYPFRVLEMYKTLVK